MDAAHPVTFSRMKLAKGSINTHEWKPFEEIWNRYSAEAQRVRHDLMLSQGIPVEFACDPFARNCVWAAPFTNDINPESLAISHIDAEDFLFGLERAEYKFGIVVLDPPFSDRMAKDRYGTGNLYASDSGKMTRIQRLAGSLVVPNGFIIKAGYNSAPPHPCFELVEIRLLNMGTIQADVIFSVWRKTQHTLGDGWG